MSGLLLTLATIDLIKDRLRGRLIPKKCALLKDRKILAFQGARLGIRTGAGCHPLQPRDL